MKPKIYLHFDNIPIEEYDISLANRIIFWETLHYLNNINNNYFQISLEREFYQDLDDLVFFPNTTQHNSSDIPKDVIIIKKNELKKFMRGEKRLNKNSNYHIILDELQNFHHFDIQTPQPRPLVNLRFHDFIYESIRNVVDKRTFFSIHVRRGDGVNFSDEFYENLSSKAKLYVKKGFYTFYDDSYYHPFIREIQSINKNQRFYIAHDLTYEDMKYWKDIFGEKSIIFNHELFQEVFDFFSDRPHDVISAIIDMLVLYHSDFNFVNDESTFSGISAHDTFRVRYDIKGHIPNAWQRFIEEYKKHIKNKKII